MPARRHGEAHRTKEYEAWKEMFRRCSDAKRPGYQNWGGRGITVCDRWKLYENFLADIGRAPSRRHSLDRIDNERNYEPGNVRWATFAQQQRNRRSCRPLSWSGKTMTIVEWSELLGVPEARICARLNLGWSTEDALTKPKHYRPKPAEKLSIGGKRNERTA